MRFSEIIMAFVSFALLVTAAPIAGVEGETVAIAEVDEVASFY